MNDKQRFYPRVADATVDSPETDCDAGFEAETVASPEADSDTEAVCPDSSGGTEGDVVSEGSVSWPDMISGR